MFWKSEYKVTMNHSLVGDDRTRLDVPSWVEEIDTEKFRGLAVEFQVCCPELGRALKPEHIYSWSDCEGVPTCLVTFQWEQHPIVKMDHCPYCGRKFTRIVDEKNEKLSEKKTRHAFMKERGLL